MLLKADNLVKTYKMPHKTVDVLRGASLCVERGESVAVIGVSGAGKSTLLHVLGGLDRPLEGRVFLEGEDLYGLPEARRAAVRARRIGFVFQSYHLLPEMTVLENVFLPALVRGGVRPGHREIRRRARELLDRVGLANRAAHMPLELSGGEQQRVALARALMNDPELVLADEPTGNLDDATGGRVLEYLFGLIRERGHTLVMVTHSQPVAASCDRVLTLKEGRLVAAAQ